MVILLNTLLLVRPVAGSMAGWPREEKIVQEGYRQELIETEGIEGVVSNIRGQDYALLVLLLGVGPIVSAGMPRSKAIKVSLAL